MKKIKNVFGDMKVIVFTLFFILFHIGCTKYSFKSYEKKIVGKWAFERVQLKMNNSLSYTDISYRYKHYTYEFLKNGDFKSVDTFNKDTTLGNWVMEKSVYYDGESTVTEYYLTISTYDTATSYFIDQVWQITNIGYKLRTVEKTDKANYKYVLSRL